MTGHFSIVFLFLLFISERRSWAGDKATGHDVEETPKLITEIPIDNIEVQATSVDSVENRIKAYTEKIKNFIKAGDGPLGSWTCNSGQCIPTSIQMAERLKRSGFPVRLISVESRVSEEIKDHDGKLHKSLYLHHFIVDDSLGREVVIDPSYLQFLGDNKALGRPSFFVGTSDDLKNIYKAFWNKNLIQSLTPESSFYDVGLLGVDGYLEHIYGFGESGAKYRTVIDKSVSDIIKGL